MRALPLKTLAVTLAAGIALAACATATPYQPAGFNGQRGGYAEQRLENNRFRVSFSGNSVTSRGLTPRLSRAPPVSASTPSSSHMNASHVPTKKKDATGPGLRSITTG